MMYPSLDDACCNVLKHPFFVFQSNSFNIYFDNSVLKVTIWRAATTETMLSNKKLIVNKPFSKPGNTIHTADAYQFVTLRYVRASTDDGEITLPDDADGDMFRITVTDNISLWIPLKSAKDGVLLHHFPLSEEEDLRVSVSQNLIGKYMIFGYVEYAE